MWRVQRLDQINALKPANLFDFKSLALKIRKKQIGRFKTVTQPTGELFLRHPIDRPASRAPLGGIIEAWRALLQSTKFES